MDCKEIEKYLISYAEGVLDTSLSTEIEKHLTSCESCRKELQEIEFLFELLQKDKEIEPSEKLRSGFYQMLEREKQEQSAVIPLQREKSFSWKPLMRIAATIALIISGYYFGKYQQNKLGQEQLATLNTEKQEVEKTMMLALLENESASKRVQGVNYIEEISDANTEIIQALIKRMDYDENINVRLAAVEALGNFSDSELARKALINSLEYQEVAEVQIAIIQILGNFKEQRAIKPMEKLLEKEDVPPFVKDQIRLQLPNLA
ncbi:hypothetical protein GWK08_09195 [Leptobacterium flavescens]|uniref:Putative zinc-finger domain-containing protein n=1 Tax=Leptobacterium flavescens TaxID=472055 RepID=A0A6P0UJR6_9FLAO|nr:HEAT repeat domain-containing protein [Leptobacterium flavescens]NER13611.1 hypothetical protein [Leptobacterium flavescens]